MPYNWKVSHLFKGEDLYFVVLHKSVLKNPVAVVFGFEVLAKNPISRFVAVTPESPAFELPDQQMVDFRKHFFRNNMPEIITPPGDNRISSKSSSNVIVTNHHVEVCLFSGAG